MSAAAAAVNQMVMSVLKFTYLFQETYEQATKISKNQSVLHQEKFKENSMLFSFFFFLSLNKTLDNLIL